MNSALLIYVCAIGLVTAAALYTAGARVRCVKCGRRCDGRICGGTIDAPRCWECADHG